MLPARSNCNSSCHSFTGAVSEYERFNLFILPVCSRHLFGSSWPMTASSSTVAGRNVATDTLNPHGLAKTLNKTIGSSVARETCLYDGYRAVSSHGRDSVRASVHGGRHFLRRARELPVAECGTSTGDTATVAKSNINPRLGWVVD
jgi:hypothetical protein